MKKNILNIIFCILLLSNTLAVSADDTLLKKGKELYKKGQFSEAMEYFINIPFKDRTEEIMLLTANSYYSMGNKAHALSMFRSLIKKYPKSYSAYYNIGLINLQNGYYELAINNFKNAIDFNKDFEPAYYNLGISYYKHGNYKLAYKYFKKASRISNDNSNTYYNLYLTCLKLKKKSKADKYLKRYNKLLGSR